MGMNVSIYRAGAGGRSVEHPEWDDTRYAGDRDIPDALYTVGQYQRDGTDDLEAIPWVRPKDPAALRREMEARYPESAGRWRQLEDILSDQGWWLYISH